VTTVDDFTRLLDAWRAGSRAALGELLTRYSDPVRAAIRNRLNDRLRSEYDSLDFVQEVWAAVAEIQPDEFTFPTQDALVGFLVQVARNKVIDTCRRRLNTQGYAKTREQALVRAADGATLPIPGTDPTPSQWAVAAERWSEIVADLPPLHVAVMERLRDGYTQVEVAAMTGMTDRTVRRIVARAQRVLGGVP
jgi:RNA polymerase sigma factor (sigma-70 family)